MEKLKLGVVGATGMVGEVFLELLAKREFPVEEIRLFASEKSEGHTRLFQNKKISIKTLSENCFAGLDLVFFSSGDEVSQKWAPLAVEQGAFAVDNSAAFRMNELNPLVVPEINAHLLSHKNSPQLIANPNCSTIQMVLVLHPLHKAFQLTDLKVATYQAVSGAGKAAKEELLKQTAQILDNKPLETPENFAHSMAFNCLPHIGSFNDQGYSSEEMKMINETRKILELPELPVSAFAVRIPVLNGHSEALWVTLKKQVKKEEIIECLKNANGLKVIEHNEAADYPHVLMASGDHSVFVGRIHQDLNDPHTWLIWVVGDNILKGAALNGLQIAEHIFF